MISGVIGYIAGPRFKLPASEGSTFGTLSCGNGPAAGNEPTHSAAQGRYIAFPVPKMRVSDLPKMRVADRPQGTPSAGQSRLCRLAA